MLLLLFVPDEEVVYRDEIGAELVANGHRFVSRRAGERFLGYLLSQRAAMTGEVGAHTNRPELVAERGYDTKYAMHALRLGLQGIELLTTGRITLPVPDPDRSYLRSLRRGEVALPEVLASVAAVLLVMIISGLLRSQSSGDRAGPEVITQGRFPSRPVRLSVDP